MEIVKIKQVKSKIMNSKIIYIFILLVLFAGVVFLSATSMIINQNMKKVLAINSANASIASFNKLFIEKVLKTKGEVSYEDRLKLENAVVNTKDADIAVAWKVFLASATEKEAQEKVLVLLSLFANKLVY